MIWIFHDVALQFQDYHLEKDDDELRHLGSALDQFAGLAIEGGALQEEPVHINPFWWRVVDVFLAKPGGEKVQEYIS